MPTRGAPELIGGLIVVDLDGYSGRGPELVRYEMTATGVRVTITGALAMVLQLAGVNKTNLKATIT